MSINEEDRLDLRQAFETVFADERTARLAMEAMPPIDYSQLATKQDISVLRHELQGDMAQLRGEFAELKGEFAELKGSIAADLARLDAKIDWKAAENLKVTVLTSLSTTVLLGGYVTAVLG